VVARAAWGLRFNMLSPRGAGARADNRRCRSGLPAVPCPDALFPPRPLFCCPGIGLVAAVAMSALRRGSHRRTLALALVDALGERIRDGRLAIGAQLPTEAAVVAEFGVSRTVVREAISRLQAGGLVATRHGVGTFVIGPGAAAGGEGGGPGFRVAPEQFATLRDVIAVLELRIGIESEAAALAALRRKAENLGAMRRALDTMTAAVDAGEDAVLADFEFHLQLARATQNPHFSDLMAALGSTVIPRARLAGAGSQAPAQSPSHQAYLRRVQAEHEGIFAAIAAQNPDAARAAMRTHLANSRERRRQAAALLADPGAQAAVVNSVNTPV
jgi:GntR family transcriptional repressor for pyruvate dehydrogenase complex